MRDFARTVWDTGEPHCTIPVAVEIATPTEPEAEWQPDPYDDSMSGHWTWKVGGRWVRIPSKRLDDASTPLAKIVHPLFCYHSLRELFSECAPPAELLTLLSWINTDALAAQLASDATRLGKKSSPHIRNADFEQLSKTGTVELAPTREARGHVKAFKVPKDEDKARLIVDGRPFDEMVEAAGCNVPSMPAPGLHIREVLDTLLEPGLTCIATVDAASMFYQFEIHPALRRYFNFLRPDCDVEENKSVRLRVLPMGICFAPAWAQHVSQYLLEVTRSRCPPVPNRSKWVAVVWIDNFIFAADSPDTLATVRAVFDGVARSVRLQLKPWEGGGHALDILGVHIDLATRLITPKETILAKLEQFADAMNQPTITAIEFLRGFGRACFVSFAVARYPLCLVPEAMQRLRTICRTANLKLKLPTTTELRREIRDWTVGLAVARYSRQSLPEASVTCHYATDASTIGMGAVIVGNGSTNSWRCAVKTSYTAIHIAEMLAGVITAAMAESPASWAVDNTNAFHAMLKGHAGSCALDELLRLWLTVARPPLRASRVPTEAQPADTLSRCLDPTSTQLTEWSATAWLSFPAVTICWRAPPKHP
jgi:hypothetical protein